MQVLVSFIFNETLSAIASVFLTPWLYELCWWFSIQIFPSCSSCPLTPVLLCCTSKKNLTWHESSFFQFSKIYFSLCKWVTWSIVPLLSQITDLGAQQPVTWLPHHIHADAGIKAFWQKCRKSTLPSYSSLLLSIKQMIGFFQTLSFFNTCWTFPLSLLDTL